MAHELAFLLIPRQLRWALHSAQAVTLLEDTDLFYPAIKF